MYPVKLIFSKNFTLSLIVFLILFHNTANSHPEELTRDKIIEKLSKAFLEKNEEKIYVADCRILDYNEHHDDISLDITPLLLLQGKSFETDASRSIRLPIVFFHSDGKDKLVQLKKNGKLDSTFVLGYIDPEYECFVCLRVSSYL